MSEATGCDDADYFEEVYEVCYITAEDLTDQYKSFVAMFSILFPMVCE